MKYSKNKSKQEYIHRINCVIDYIKANIDSNLTLEQLSSVANFSKFYFHRIFKSISGETLNEYVSRSRLEKSAFTLLYNPNISITNIALNCGFSSSAVYSRAFKKNYHLTPSEWRTCSIDKKSKISKTIRNSCKEINISKMYFDSLNTQLTWRIKMNKNETINVKVRELPEYKIAYVRHHGEYKTDDKVLFQNLFEKLLKWAVPNGLFKPPETKAFTVYSSGHPDTTKPENLNVDVCISIEDGVKVTGDVGKRNLSGGQYAVIHLDEATIDECQNAWKIVFDNWLPESGYQPDDRNYYIEHLNNPEEHPEKLHCVNMCLPIKAL